MKPMKLGVHIGYWGLGLSSDDQRAIVQEAERLGYDSVWAAEAYGSDAATILGWLAGPDVDDQARLGDLPDARPQPGDDGDDRRDDRPALRRADAARHRLLRARRSPRAGTASASARQMQRTREYVAVVRKALARERLEFDGETLTLPLPDGPGKALKLTIAPVQEQIPIYLAAIGPNNTRLAGEIADGWIPTLFSPEHVAEFAPAARGGRGAQRPLAGGLRHRAARSTSSSPTTSPPARDLDAPVRRAVRRRHGLARAELLQRARAALRLRGRGARRAGPLPRRQARRGGGAPVRRAHRHRLAVRPARARPRAPRGLPRGRRRHARRQPAGVHARRAPRAAAPASRSSRPDAEPPRGSCSARSATRGTRSR